MYSGVCSSLSAGERQAAVVELVGRHRHGLRFGQDLKKTETQFSDDYLLVAAHLLLITAQKDAITNTVFQVTTSAILFLIFLSAVFPPFLLLRIVHILRDKKNGEVLSQAHPSVHPQLYSKTKIAAFNGVSNNVFKIIIQSLRGTLLLYSKWKLHFNS